MRKMIILIGLLLILPTSTLAASKIPILVYHSIAPYKGTGSKELYVTPEQFKKQMLWLKEQGYTLLTFEQWDEKEKVKKPIFVTFDDGYKNNLNAYEIFKSLSDGEFHPRGTIFAISEFIGKPGRLNRPELKELSQSGFFSIQSHTSTHPDLTEVANLTSELKKPKEIIEMITGQPVIALSYPYGNTNEKVVAETKNYYKFGLTTTPGPYIKRGYPNELYYLPRIYVKYSTTLEEFSRLVSN